MTVAEHDERPKAGRKILKWLAPLMSGAVLSYLIVRVSTCGEAPARDTSPSLVALPPVPAALANVKPSNDARAQGEGLLGGSKSGTLGVMKAQEAAGKKQNEDAPVAPTDSMRTLDE